MAGAPEYFDRIRGQIDASLLATKYVVVVGVGTVGSPVAEHLAKDGVGRLLFVDGDRYEEANRVRHVLPPDYLGMNKAEAMRDYLLSERIPGLQVDARAQNVDDSMSDTELDALLDPADLIIAGTGETDIQRRLGRRALALDIPAIFPGLIPGGGGEVFIQTSPQNPCFLCRDAWRRTNDPVRGVEALGVEAMPVIQTTIELSLGILDPNSRYEEITTPDDSDPARRPRQLFLMMPEAARIAEAVPRRRNCPSCAVGPSPLRREGETLESPTRSTPSPSAAGSSAAPAPRDWSALAVADRARLGLVTVTFACVVVAVAIIALAVSATHKSSVVTSNVYRVKMNHVQSLTGLIASSGLLQGKGLPVAERDVTTRPEPEALNVVLVRLNNLRSYPNWEAGIGYESPAYPEWIKALHKLGYRPATLPELLALCEQYPAVRTMSRLVELETFALPSNSEDMEYAEADNGYLNLQETYSSGSIKGDQYQFVAVRR